MQHSHHFLPQRHARRILLAASILGVLPWRNAVASENPVPSIPNAPFLTNDWNEHYDGARPGTLVLLGTPQGDLSGQEAEAQPSMPTVTEIRAPSSVEQREELAEKPRWNFDSAATSSIIIYDEDTGLEYLYSIERSELAKAAHAVSLTGGFEEGGLPIDPNEYPDEAEAKSWSNATDNRTRRGTQDGWSATHSVYQNIADYGGCSANIVWASGNEMVALTAAHCIYQPGGGYTTAHIRPRRNGTTSAIYGAWDTKVFYAPSQFQSLDCADAWKEECIQHDIAIVRAERIGSAQTPSGAFGWAAVSASYMNNYAKYRRGYPLCGNPHSPSPCSTNTLYGDGAMTVGQFSSPDSDSWNRRFRFSSDLSPGDSGSGLYYLHSNGNNYVFGVTSAEDGCFESCTSSRPNHGRRVTPETMDWINIMIP